MPSAYILDLFDAPPRKAREYQPTFWQASFCGIPIPLHPDAERQLAMMHADTMPNALDELRDLSGASDA